TSSAAYNTAEFENATVIAIVNASNFFFISFFLSLLFPLNFFSFYLLVPFIFKKVLFFLKFFIFLE
ncbi:MAG: hypothetical protein ACI4C5_00165, partial [Lachnospiraceae bacterium]